MGWLLQWKVQDLIVAKSPKPFHLTFKVIIWNSTISIENQIRGKWCVNTKIYFLLNWAVLAYEQWMVGPNAIYDFVAVCEQYVYVNILKSSNIIPSIKTIFRRKKVYLSNTMYNSISPHLALNKTPNYNHLLKFIKFLLNPWQISWEYHINISLRFKIKLFPMGISDPNCCDFLVWKYRIVSK